MTPYAIRRVIALSGLGLTFLITLAILTGCSRDTPQETSAPDTEALQVSATPEVEKEPVDLIAYVGHDANIYTINPDGTGRARITEEEGLYTWPTWSPDSSNLVFSGITGITPESSNVGLFSLVKELGQVKQIYVNQRRARGFIADTAPHYPIWSPDSQRVAFISQTVSGLSLFLDNPGDDEYPTPVVGGGPMYLSWSPDSRYILLHVRLEHLLLDTHNVGGPEDLSISSPSYRAPAWSPQGDRIIFAGENDVSDQTLFLADPRGENRVRLMDVPGNVAFLWSPKGDHIAVARTTAFGEPLYDGLQLISVDSLETRYLTNDKLFAYFWSPDGNKIAYITITEELGVFRWKVVDIDEATERTLVDFEPSDGLFILFSFFDQYAYSHQLWSPDSRSLVFAGLLQGGPDLVSMGMQPNDKIYVMEVEGPVSPRAIADGILAFWSPR